jgi:hypothetical protein
MLRKVTAGVEEDKCSVVANRPIAVPRNIFVGGRPDAKPGSAFAGRR